MGCSACRRSVRQLCQRQRRRRPAQLPHTLLRQADRCSTVPGDFPQALQCTCRRVGASSGVDWRRARRHVARVECRAVVCVEAGGRRGGGCGGCARWAGAGSWGSRSSSGWCGGGCGRSRRAGGRRGGSCGCCRAGGRRGGSCGCCRAGGRRGRRRGSSRGCASRPCCWRSGRGGTGIAVHVVARSHARQHIKDACGHDRECKAVGSGREPGTLRGQTAYGCARAVGMAAELHALMDLRLSSLTLCVGATGQRQEAEQQREAGQLPLPPRLPRHGRTALPAVRAGRAGCGRVSTRCRVRGQRRAGPGEGRVEEWLPQHLRRACPGHPPASEPRQLLVRSDCSVTSRRAMLRGGRRGVVALVWRALRGPARPGAVTG